LTAVFASCVCIVCNPVHPQVGVWLVHVPDCPAGAGHQGECPLQPHHHSGTPGAGGLHHHRRWVSTTRHRGGGRGGGSSAEVGAADVSRQYMRSLVWPCWYGHVGEAWSMSHRRWMGGCTVKPVSCT
jgi:hypothetical protein